MTEIENKFWNSGLKNEKYNMLAEKLKQHICVGEKLKTYDIETVYVEDEINIISLTSKKTNNVYYFVTLHKRISDNIFSRTVEDDSFDKIYNNTVMGFKVYSKEDAFNYAIKQIPIHKLRITSMGQVVKLLKAGVISDSKKESIMLPLSLMYEGKQYEKFYVCNNFHYYHKDEEKYIGNVNINIFKPHNPSYDMFKDALDYIDSNIGNGLHANPAKVFQVLIEFILNDDAKLRPRKIDDVLFRRYKYQSGNSLNTTYMVPKELLPIRNYINVLSYKKNLSCSLPVPKLEPCDFFKVYYIEYVSDDSSLVDKVFNPLNMLIILRRISYEQFNLSNEKEVKDLIEAVNIELKQFETESSNGLSRLDFFTDLFYYMSKIADNEMFVEVDILDNNHVRLMRSSFFHKDIGFTDKTYLNKEWMVNECVYEIAHVKGASHENARNRLIYEKFDYKNLIDLKNRLHVKLIDLRINCHPSLKEYYENVENITSRFYIYHEETLRIEKLTNEYPEHMDSCHASNITTRRCLNLEELLEVNALMIDGMDFMWDKQLVEQKKRFYEQDLF